MPGISRTALCIASCLTLLSLSGPVLSAQNTNAAPAPANLAPVTVNPDSASIARILKLRDQIEEQSKTFHFGLSLGWRHILSSTGTVYRDVVIDPMTDKVEVDPIDNGDFVLSGIVTAFPFDEKARFVAIPVHNLGFLANVNIASFSSDNLATFNKSMEGGFGLAWRMKNDFAIGLTIERMFSRSLRDFVKPGQVLVVGKDTLTSISKDDGRFFKDDNLTDISFKFLYFLK